MLDNLQDLYIAVHRERETNGRQSNQWQYYIGSLDRRRTAREIADYVRGHWSAENNLHWQLDVLCRLVQATAVYQRVANTMELATARITLQLLYGTGLRILEAIALDCIDVDLRESVSIPVVIRDKPRSEADAMEIRLIENVAREGLQQLEQAMAPDQLMKAGGFNASQAARRVGMKPSAVSKLLALLQLPEFIRDQINVGRINAGAGYQLSQIDDAKLQSELAGGVAGGALSPSTAGSPVRPMDRLSFG